MPCSASLNAIEKIPADALSLLMGVEETCQLAPQSEVRKTRAAPPPVPNHALPRPPAVMQLPLAAKAPSRSTAAGIFAAGFSFHVTPPSSVEIVRNLPSTGSLTAIPCIESQNAMASKNAFGLRFVNCSFQC